MKLPIRVRLTILFALGMALVVGGLGAFVYLRAARDLLGSVDLGLRARAQAIVDASQQQGTGGIGSSGSLIDPDEAFAQILDGSGRVVEASSPSMERALLSPAEVAGLADPRFVVRNVPSIDVDPVRLLAVPAGSGGGPLVVVVGATLGDRQDALKGLLFALLVGGPVAVVLLSAAAWVVVGGALRPVERMRREADAISLSEPGRRLPVPITDDEIARLGATLNAMLDRLERAFERERRFVDDASHELRTPLSVLKMELDLALARGRTPEELTAALGAAAQETDRIVRLAEELLVLARMEGGRLPLRRASVPIRALVEESVAASADRARRAGVSLDIDAPDAPAWIDPARVRQALENLVDNALHHSVPGGSVVVRASRSAAGIEISVRDTGPGFPPELIERAFEPFTRSATEGNGAGGAGLGLAIVRAVAEAHGGTATAENPPEGGARVSILLGE